MDIVTLVYRSLECQNLPLWALSALCACAGVIALLEAEGRPLAYLGGFVLWAFAAYAVKVAGALGKRS